MSQESANIFLINKTPQEAAAQGGPAERPVFIRPRKVNYIAEAQAIDYVVQIPDIIRRIEDAVFVFVGVQAEHHRAIAARGGVEFTHHVVPNTRIASGKTR